jgi:hypothetical protein
LNFAAEMMYFNVQKKKSHEMTDIPKNAECDKTVSNTDVGSNLTEGSREKRF